MNITFAKYQNDFFTGELSTIKVTADGVEFFVPLDPANRHYQEIMALVEAGELTIEPAD
jgi:hypothetical protein